VTKRAPAARLGTWDLSFAAALLLVALALGGGSGWLAVGPMLAEMLGLALLFYLLTRRDSDRLLRGHRPEFALLVAVAALPLLQLVPLPPLLWQGLPGRDATVAIAELTGTEGRWRPLSTDPQATLSAVLALIPAAAMFFAGLLASAREKRLLFTIVVAVAVVSGGIALFQWVGSLGGLFADVDNGYQLGLFANRNHEADLLLVALVLLTGLGGERRGAAAIPLILLAAAFLLCSLLLTQSRTAFVLLFLGAVGVATFVPGPGRWPPFVRWAIALTPLAMLAFLLSPAVSTASVTGRFAATEELRPQIWSTAAEAAGSYAPFGSGIGTFNLVYEQSEGLGALTQGWIPHAHNEYLELVLETGVIGAGLIALFFLLFFRRLTGLRGLPGARLERAAGLAALLMLLHSAVDYPLRNVGLSSLFGLLLGCLMMPSPRARPRRAAPAPALAWRASFAAALVGLAVLVLSDGMLMTAMEKGRYGAALEIDRGSSIANGYAAEADFDAGRYALAERRARRALEPALAYPRALRVLGFARELQNDYPGAAAAMGLAARLGWRDIPTQSWLMLDALSKRRWASAARHGDAVARQGFGDWAFGPLDALFDNEAGRAELRRRLAEGPPWREAFIRHLATLPAARLDDADAIATSAATQDRPLGGEEIQPLLDRLIAEQRFGAARRLWQASLGARSGLQTGLVYDGSFTGRGGAGNDYVPPFEWRLTPGQRSQAWLSEPPSGDGRALRIVSSGYSGERLAAQTLLLAPGQYRLAVSALADMAGPADATEWKVSCRPAGQVLGAFSAPARLRAWTRSAMVFRVPAGCAAQQLELSGKPTIDGQSISWFDAVEVARVGN
jgi:O-antigen ligase